MKDDSSDNHAFKVLNLMMKSFDQDEVKRLYFELRVPESNVPMPASTQTYIMHLIKFMARKNRQNLLISKLQDTRPHLDWPESYTLPSESDDFSSSKFHIEHFIQEQHINIVSQAKKPRRNAKQRSKNYEL